MKIFNEENGVKKVYVQLNDIARIIHSDAAIPRSIMERFFYNVFIVNDDNRFEFEEFSDPRELEFFESLDWIVDYKKYRNMSEKELIDHGTVVAEDADAVACEYNENINSDDNDYLESLMSKHEDLQHKMYSIREILWLKQGYRVMPIPEVPDSDGFVLTGDSDTFPYVARQGLNPLQFMISKKDGSPLKGTDIIPMGFLQSAQSLSITENMDKNEFFGDFESINKLSDDEKSFIITYRIITPEEKEEKEKKAVQDTEKIMGCSSKDSKLTFGKRVTNKLREIFNR